MNAPVVPVEWETMNCNYVYFVQHAVAAEQLHKSWINRRQSTQNDREPRADLPDLACCRNSHMGKYLPVGVQVKIPVREVVGLVPQHHCFNHSSLRVSQRAL